ncbi:hypothetical protein GTO10_01120 [Candidatus Saccharibacteria bacterium]|nr:hypothetical protein [Candidatus Saccharibacteria bacterium]
MVYKRKTWTEKLHDSKDLPKVRKITSKQAKYWGVGTIVIPKPLEVDELMRKVPKGRVTTINEIRETLAKKHGATIGCPITCGIFARIAAEAAEEQKAKGAKNTTAYWRTLRQGGEVNPKYPGGVEGQKRHLEAEGHNVVQKGERAFVADYQKILVSL